MFTSEGSRLAIVDDDQDLAQLLKEVFELEGFEVWTFLDGPPLLRHIQRRGLPHLAIVDLNLPRMHGFDLSEALKKLGDIPIVFLTNESEPETIVEGIRRYAEDYVTKPFNVNELVARVRRVLSRISDFSFARAPLLRIDDWLAVDFGNRRLIVGDAWEPLTPTEASLLHVLIRHAGNTVPNGTLLARAWPLGEVYEETLRVHMHRLRRKIERDVHQPHYILTVRGIGYQFVAAAAAAPSAGSNR